MNSAKFCGSNDVKIKLVMILRNRKAVCSGSTIGTFSNQKSEHIWPQSDKQTFLLLTKIQTTLDLIIDDKKVR